MEKLRHFLDDAGFSSLLIEVDGNISFENASILRKQGADIFVAGTSSIFCEGYGAMDKNIGKLRSVISI